MKYQDKVKMLLAAALITSVFLSIAITAPKVHADDSVVLVHLQFEKERWALGKDGVKILPCPAPSKFIMGSEGDPMIRLLGEKEEVVKSWNMRNPRLILMEEPSKESPMLSQVSFKLRFQLINNIDRVEFWYNPRNQKEPDVAVNIGDAIRKYIELGGASQQAACQEPEYKPNQR